ncbi:MAG: hypothetical protein PSW75_12490 [bacterium]|nr:hypothetical protein [bacterium]MDI1335753.1 hypothetical protein [Lacunisphaera sp.]
MDPTVGLFLTIFAGVVCLGLGAVVRRPADGQRQGWRWALRMWVAASGALWIAILVSVGTSAPTLAAGARPLLLAGGLVLLLAGLIKSSKRAEPTPRKPTDWDKLGS